MAAGELYIAVARHGALPDRGGAPDLLLATTEGGKFDKEDKGARGSAKARRK